MECVFEGRLSERVKRAEAALSAERSVGRVLRVLLSGECLALFVNFVRDQTCVDGALVFAGEGPTVFVKLGLINKWFCSSLDGYDGE